MRKRPGKASPTSPHPKKPTLAWAPWVLQQNIRLCLFAAIMTKEPNTATATVTGVS